MLEYNRIDISEGIDIKKCKETSRECSLCKFYYFLDKNFNYGRYLSAYIIKMNSQKIKFGDKEVDQKKNSIHLKKLFY